MTPADPGVCVAACDHASAIEERARLSKLDDFEPPMRARQRKAIVAKTPELAKKCTALCQERGTRSQTTCIQSATNLEELAKCTRLPKRKPAKEDTAPR